MGNPKINIRDQWDRAAASYIRFREAGDGYNERIETAAMRGLLGDVRGLRILDAGCGTGEHARYCARNGAQVTGVDISVRMVEEARRLAVSEKLDIEFHQRDLAEMSMFPDDHFDAVVCSVVIVDHLNGIIAELRRVLRAGGRLYLSDCHPMFNSGTQEIRENMPCLVVRNYFDRSEREVCNPFGKSEDKDDLIFRWRHQTLQDYFDALADNGFVVERFLEPQPTQDENDEAAVRARCYPVFFIVKARCEKQ